MGRSVQLRVRDANLLAFLNRTRRSHRAFHVHPFVLRVGRHVIRACHVVVDADALHVECPPRRKRHNRVGRTRVVKHGSLRVNTRANLPQFPVHDAVRVFPRLTQHVLHLRRAQVRLVTHRRRQFRRRRRYRFLLTPKRGHHFGEACGFIRAFVDHSQAHPHSA